MIGYATLGTNNIAAARGFYDALLGSIGAARIMEFGDDLGGFTMWGTGWDKPGLAVTNPYDKNTATIGNGSMIALTVDTRAKVDALHAKALELGGSCEGPPGLRGDEGPQAFYGAYFRDLDGNKLCAFRTGPA
ncbi:MAG: glyoxalase [Sphingomonas sp. 28-62-20]|uniref:VOC family protein n=1 Tax=unclassified Sphingomonas TaxID=196159 RepID=UPI000B0F988B|nr:VOC family protein [Sphingomonas sp.]OYY77391.1 MAG: glyoxalase [Sphingomonas sp. 28-62-20]